MGLLYNNFIITIIPNKSIATEVLKKQAGLGMGKMRGSARKRDGLKAWPSRNCDYDIFLEGQVARLAAQRPMVLPLTFCYFCVKIKVSKIMIFNKLLFCYIEGKGTKKIVWLSAKLLADTNN